MSTYAAKAIAIHKASDPDPIRLRAGDLVTVGGRGDEHPGWVWASGPDGRSGWVAKSILDEASEGVTAVEDYDAVELDLWPGQEVEVNRQLEDWVWVTNGAGLRGWVPAATLERID